MLFLFSACLMFDLAGDSVYQADPSIEPVTDPDNPMENPPDGGNFPEGIDQVGMYGLEYTESEGFG